MPDPPPPATTPAPRTGDRRRTPTPRFSRHSFWGGRRRAPRRSREFEGSYVDVYGSGLLGLVLWIALMNVGDSFFTLRHLQNGGIELNPVAEQLLRAGRTGFVLSKGLLIAVALVVLTIHKNFRLARVGLWIAATGYTVLFGYHLWLLGV